MLLTDNNTLLSTAQVPTSTTQEPQAKPISPNQQKQSISNNAPTPGQAPYGGSIISAIISSSIPPPKDLGPSTAQSIIFGSGVAPAFTDKSIPQPTSQDNTPPSTPLNANGTAALWGNGTPYPTKNSYYAAISQEGWRQTVQQDPTATTPFDVIPTGPGTDAYRYMNAKIGNSTYIEGTDNEERNAKNQSWLAQFRNSLIKAGAIAVGTFVDNAMTFPDVAKFATGGGVASLYQSSMEKSTDTWLNNMETWFPNYVTKLEQSRPFYINMIPFTEGSANFWGEDIVKNIGFTVGAIGGALAQDAVIGAATGWVGDAVNIPRQVGLLALKLNKTFTVAKDAGEALEGASDALKLGNGIADLRKAVDYTSTFNKIGNTAAYSATVLGAARTEAGWEARQGYTQLKGDLIQEYKDSHNGDDPDSDTMDGIEKSATASANVRFLANIAILSLSDAIQFDSVFNLFHAERKGLASSLGIEIGGPLKIKATDNTLGGIDNLVEAKPQGLVAKFMRPRDMVEGILSEGFYEEGLQNVAQEGTYNYYHNKYYDKNKNTWKDVLNSTAYGFSNTFGTTSGWEQVVAGALMSLVSTPATERLAKSKNDKAMQIALSELNKQGVTGSFENKYADAANSLQASQDMKKAAQAGNLFEYKNLKHDAFFNLINSGLKTGRFDVRIEQLKMLKDLSNDDFTKLFQLDPTDDNRKNASQYIDNLIDKANQIKTDYNAIKLQFPNPYQAYDKPDTDDKLISNYRYNQHNEWVESLSYYASMQHDLDNRLLSIPKRWDEDKLGLSDVTPDIAAKPLSWDGLQELSEKYEGNKWVSQAINTLKENIKNSEEPNLDAYETIIDNEVNRSIPKPHIHRLAYDGGDINYINQRKQQALDAYKFLSSKDGEDYFKQADDQIREETAQDIKDHTAEVKFGSQGNRTFKFETGKKYYLFSQENTPEGVPVRRGSAYNVDKISNNNITLSPDNNTGRIVLPLSELSNLEAYTEDEVGKTDKGQKFINSLRTGQRWAMTVDTKKVQTSPQLTTHQHIAPRTYRGTLDYNPSEDNLRFKYVDEEGKMRDLPLSLEQFDNNFKEGFGKFKLRPDGGLQNIESAIKKGEGIRKAERINTAKQMRDALETAIINHRVNLEKVNQEIEKNNNALESAQKTLSTLEEKQKNIGEVSAKSYKTLMSHLKGINTRISNINNAINSLESSKVQLDYTISYLSQIKDDIPNEGVEPFSNLIVGAEAAIRDIDNKISSLQKIRNALAKVFDKFANIAKSFVRKVKDSPAFKEFDLTEFNEVVKPNGNIESILQNSDEILTKLEKLSGQIEAADENTSLSGDQIDVAKSALSSLDEQIKIYQLKSNANKALVQALYDKVDQLAAIKAETERLNADKVYLQRLFDSSRFFFSDPNSNPPTNPPQDDEKGFPNEPAKKSINNLYRSTISNQDEETQTPAQKRLDLFYNKTDHFSNRNNQRIILVTKNNEDALKLTGLTQSEWDRAVKLFPDTFKEGDITNQDTGVILSVFVEEDPSSHKLFFIDNDGKRIGEVGKDTPKIDEIIYSHMPTSSKEWLNHENRYRSTASEEELNSEIEAWKEQRQNIFDSKGKIGGVYEYSTSNGFSQGEAEAKNNTHDTGLTTPEELNNTQVVFVSSKNNPIRRDGKDLNIPNGRPVINNRSNFAFLNNRKLTKNEIDTVSKAIVQLARTAEERRKNGNTENPLDQDIIQYLKGIVFWGTDKEGKTTFRNQLGIGHGTLNMGEKNETVPFTVAALEQELSNKVNIITSFLGRIYNNVAGYKVEKTNSPYREYYVGKDGKLQFREWSNYQNYLLSPTFQPSSRDESGQNGAKRENGEIPLTVSLNNITKENPINHTGRYATLQNLYESKPIEKPGASTKEGVPIQEDNGNRVVADGKTLNTINIHSGLLKKDVDFGYTITPETKEITYSGGGKSEVRKEDLYRLDINKDETYNELKEALQKLPNLKGNPDDVIVSSVIKELLSKNIIKNQPSEIDGKLYVDLAETPTSQENGPIITTNPIQQANSVEKEALEDEPSATDEALAALARKLAATTTPPSNIGYRKAVNPNNIPPIGSEEWNSFEEYMRANLPQFNTEQFHHLITMIGGGFAYGSMEDALIKVFKGAPRGTEYHEAFEGVWAYFTTPEMRDSIYGELRNKKGTFFDILSGKDISFKNASNEQLKEWAADRFGRYVYDSKPVKGASLLRKAFDTIINWFKNLLIHRTELGKLFKKINTGYFKDIQIGPDSQVAYKPIPGLNANTIKDINDQITSSIMNRVFSEKSSLFDINKLTSKDLYESAKSEVNNSIGQLYLAAYNDKTIPQQVKKQLLTRIENQMDAIDANWDAIVSRNKEVLKTFDIELNDNGGLTATDVGRNFKDYDKDYYKIDNIKSAPPEIKLLIGTLAVRARGEKAKSTDVFGEPKVVPSTIGGVNLIPFNKAFVTVMDSLADTDGMEEMVQKLVNLGQDKPEFISLFKRLGGNLSSGAIDYNSLNDSQWRLLISFYKTFSRQKPDARIQYTNAAGTYTQSASKNDVIKSQLDNWMEDIKAKSNDPKSIIYYSFDKKLKKGTYLIAKDKLPGSVTSNDGSKEAAFLNSIGIVDVKVDAVKSMNEGDLDKFVSGVRIIHDKLIKNDNKGVPIITSKSFNSGGAFNKVARAYLSSIFREPNSVFRDENGENRNNYILHNRLSVFKNKFNKIENVEEDLSTYLPHVANDVFSSHSVVLHAKDGLYYADGKRVGNTKLPTGYIMASIDEERDRAVSVTSMNMGDRKNTEINQNINGWYYFINSVDSNTEHIINLGNYIRPGNLNINEENKAITKDISNTFKGYILDEVGLISEKGIREKNSQILRGAKGTERGADKLRFMGQILSTNSEGKALLDKIYKVTDNPTTDNMVSEVEELLNDEGNDNLLKQSLKKYFKDRTNETKEDLINLGIIAPVKNHPELFTWKNLDDNAYDDNIMVTHLKKGGSLDSDINNLISWREVNFAINNIEMHKLILGDPFQRKAKDEIKRVKLQESPRNTTYHEEIFNNQEGNNSMKRNVTSSGKKLQKGELGYVHYSTHANTSTVADIKSISTLSLNKTPNEEVNKVLSHYIKVDETDAGTWGAPWFHKQFEEKNGTWSPNKELFSQEDNAWARYELSQEGLYNYQDKDIIGEDKEIAGRLSSQPFNDKIVLSIIKPIATGDREDVPYIQMISDKTSSFPLTWGIARRYPNLKALYIRMFNSKREDGSPVDYVIMSSGRKLGTDIEDPLYSPDSGELSNEPFKSDVKVGYDTLGIITPVDYKELGKVTIGTQLRNLATMDLMHDGVPTDAEGVQKDTWDGMSEEEKEKHSALYPKIRGYQNILNSMTDAGFEKLLNKLGVNPNTLNILDKEVVAKLLQNEIFRQQLPDNAMDSIRTKINSDGETDFVYPLEATNTYKQIMGILMSEVDKSFISNKVNGIAAVQAPSTLFEKGHRKFAYKDVSGDWKILGEEGNKNFSDLTSAQKKGLLAVADTYKFYEPAFDKDGNVSSVARCEIGLSSKHLRSRLSGKLNKLSDEELITYLNKTSEGQKIIQGVAFRIPTSGLNLTEAFTIKEFLPDYYGDTAVVPSEITKKTGSDFDIDKLNIYLKNTYTDENGDLHIAPYFLTRGENDKYYSPILDKILDSKFERTLRLGQKVADRLQILKDDGVIDNWNLFKRNEKYLNNLMEEVGEDDDLFDEKVQELDNALNALEDKGIQLNDETFRNQYKEQKLRDLYSKGLENEMFESLEGLILDKNNYLRLITPNDSQKLKDAKKELNEALGIKSEIAAPLLNSRYLDKVRNNNLIGKTRVGTYSLSQVYNAVMQSERSILNTSKIDQTDMPDFFKQILHRGSKLKHNVAYLPDGTKTVDFGRVKDVSGKNNISDTINPLISGAVDMPSDQSLSELGFVEQRAATSMAMTRAGLEFDTIKWILNQPIVRDYIDTMNKEGRTNVLNVKLAKDQLSKFSGGKDTDIIDGKGLKKNIEGYYKNGKPLSISQLAEQRAIFKEFLYYTIAAQGLFDYNQSVNYDRANFTDPSLIADKEISTQRGINTGLITGVQDILDKTFLGRIRKNLHSTRDALGSFLHLEATGIRDYVDKVVTTFSKPGMYISGKNKVKIAKAVKASVIDYLVQTGGLNQEIERILVNDKTAIANKFQEIKKNNKKEFNTLAQNPVIQGLNVLSESPGRGVVNLSFNKKDMDPNDANILTEGFKELKKNIYIRENNLYDDIVKLAILQSGIDNSKISFTQFIPVDDFARIVKPVMDNINGTDLNPFVENGNFFRNNWNSNDIVPAVKVIANRHSAEGLSEGKKVLITVPYGNVPSSLLAWSRTTQKENGNLIGLLDTYNSKETKFPFVKMRFQDKENSSGKKVSYNTALYKQVLDANGDPLIHMLSDGTKTYIYKQVNAWGNRFMAREHYTIPQQSVINNSTIKVQQEFNDADVASKYNELYDREEKSVTAQIPSQDNQSTALPNFNQDNTEGTDESCPF